MRISFNNQSLYHKNYHEQSVINDTYRKYFFGKDYVIQHPLNFVPDKKKWEEYDENENMTKEDLEYIQKQKQNRRIFSGIKTGRNSVSSRPFISTTYRREFSPNTDTELDKMLADVLENDKKQLEKYFKNSYDPEDEVNPSLRLIYKDFKNGKISRSSKPLLLRQFEIITKLSDKFEKDGAVADKLVTDNIKTFQDNEHYTKVGEKRRTYLTKTQKEKQFVRQKKTRLFFRRLQNTLRIVLFEKK
jgi:hypothetical protein